MKDKKDIQDEHTLIRHVQHGDTEAFNPLVQKYYPKIYNHILGNLKDPETAKDLTQETFLKAFRAIKTFRGDSAFYSWLYRIAENVIKDNFRRQKHYTAIEPLHLIHEQSIVAMHPSPCRDVLRQELRQHLREAIATLTPLRKRVFLLYYCHDLPIKEIASRLKRSEGTIKSHLRNARLQLQEYLTSYLNNADTLSS